MASIWDELTKDGPDFLGTFGRPIKFRGKDMTALIGRAPEMQDLTSGGFVYASQFSVRLFAPNGSDLQKDIPKAGERIVVWNKNFTITGVTARYPDPWIDTFVEPTSSV